MARSSNRTLLLSGMVFALLFTVACGASSSSSTRTEPTGVGPATVYINNQSAESIYYIHMSPSSQSTWGSDLLGSNVLLPGQSWMLTNISEGYWDVRVVDASGNAKELYNEWVGAGGVYDWYIDAYNWN